MGKFKENLKSIKDNLILFRDKILPIYTWVYIGVLHIIGISILVISLVDMTQNMANIALGIISIIVIFVLCEICLFLPTIIVVSIGFIESVVAVFSIPLFLFFAAFEAMGANVDILTHGFWWTLMWCIIVTPIGYLNWKATSKFMNYIG